MGGKKIVEEYFTFTRSNRIAVLVILFLVLGVFFLPDIISKNDSSKQILNDTTWVSAMKKIEHKEVDNARTFAINNDDNSNNYQYDRNSINNYTKVKGELFYFDPNTLSLLDWKRLGIRDKTIGTIQNYLSKGGKFRTAEDVSKIYGLFPNEYERIAPFIKIQAIENSKPYTIKSENQVKENQPAKSFLKEYSILDINTSDANEFLALPGIGPAFSMRIIKFRDKLGGFYSINQVGETFGLPDSTFQNIKQYLKLENGALKKININTTTLDELKSHPYIRYILANPIIAYRNQHGQFSKIEDIKKVMTVTEELYNKIAPYLTTN